MSYAAECTTLQTLQRMRAKFESRQRFFARCIADIESDFHKQYGQFERDWQATYDVCVLFEAELEEYLTTRDLLEIEAQVLFGIIAEGKTKYRVTKARRRCAELFALWYKHDADTLREYDSHINDVRSVYRMIAVHEELG